MANLNTFGVASISTALTSRFTLRNTLQEADVVLDEDGEFHHACTFGEEHMFDAEGSGDLPADFAVAGVGPTIAGLTGGITVIDQVNESQQTGQANTWTASGEHAAGAVSGA